MLDSRAMGAPCPCGAGNDVPNRLVDAPIWMVGGFCGRGSSRLAHVAHFDRPLALEQHSTGSLLLGIFWFLGSCMGLRSGEHGAKAREPIRGENGVSRERRWAE